MPGQQAFLALAGAMFTVAACMAAGRLLLQTLRIKLARSETLPIALIAGAPPVSLFVFATLAAGVCHPPLLWAAGIAVCAAAWLRTRGMGSAEALPATPLPARIVFLAGYAAFTACYFFNALAPEIGPDGITYHMGLVGRYLRAHSFDNIRTSIYANLSQGMEMLWVPAYSIGRQSAAALVHFAFLAALPWLVWNAARRAGHPLAGAAAALIVYASPVFGVTGVSAYNDAAIAAVVFALFALLQIWERQPHTRGLLILLGLLAGFAYALKYTAFLAVPFAMGFVFWKTRRLRPLLPVALAAALLITPWVVKNWIVVGNPFSPLLNRYFPNPYVSIHFEEDYRFLMATYGLTSKLEIPWEATVRGVQLGGSLGWIFLGAPLGLLALRDPFGRRLLIAAAVFLLPYPANIGTRFLMTPAVFLALAMMLALQRIPVLPLALSGIFAVTCWPSLLPRFANRYSWRISEIPVKAALRIEPEDAFLRRRTESYAAGRLLEEKTEPGARILAFNGTGDSFTTRDVPVSFQSTYGALASDIFYCGAFPELLPERHLTLRAPLKARRVRVYQTAAGSRHEVWGVAELRVFRGQAELPRLPAWRITSNVNPWHVPLAFDNDPITRWRAMQPLEPGQFLEIDFGSEQEFDAVRVEVSHDQPTIRLELRVERGAGWETVVVQAAAETVPAPPGMQAAASRALKDYGIDYLLLLAEDFGAKQVRADPEAWQLKLVGQAGRSQLYRIVAKPSPDPIVNASRPEIKKP
ncbi:MAG: discoidin domain-containing protein [Bryobacteraceae bacterium]|nr:discoidin domain-containing protein [Bryobacteraceae bacterium]